MIRSVDMKDEKRNGYYDLPSRISIPCLLKIFKLCLVRTKVFGCGHNSEFEEGKLNSCIHLFMIISLKVEM